MPKLDLNFVRSISLVLINHEEIEIVLCGCGGTGSWLAPSIVRLARIIKESGRKVQVYFVDPDIVEDSNIPRQNFCDADLGLNKSRVLALRYGLAWGVEVVAIAQPFDPKLVQRDYSNHKLSLLIGCVDNAAARTLLASTLNHNQSHQPPQIWYLDCGNSSQSGQVLLGSAITQSQMKNAFPQMKEPGKKRSQPTFCIALPSPTVQHSELLIPLPEELENNLSCEQLALLNAQGLMVNQKVAAEAADYILRLLISRNLQRFATYFNLESGSSRSNYIVPKVVKAIEFAA